MSDQELFDEEYPVLTLVDDEGNELEFELVAELEIEDAKYKVLLPLDDLFGDEVDEESEDEDEEFDGAGVIIFKVLADAEGNEVLADIEDDEEWEMVADVWQELSENEDLD